MTLVEFFSYAGNSLVSHPRVTTKTAKQDPRNKIAVVHNVRLCGCCYFFFSQLSIGPRRWDVFVSLVMLMTCFCLGFDFLIAGYGFFFFLAIGVFSAHAICTFCH